MMTIITMIIAITTAQDPEWRPGKYKDINYTFPTDINKTTIKYEDFNHKINKTFAVPDKYENNECTFQFFMDPSHFSDPFEQFAPDFIDTIDNFDPFHFHETYDLNNTFDYDTERYAHLGFARERSDRRRQLLRLFFGGEEADRMIARMETRHHRRYRSVRLTVLGMVHVLATSLVRYITASLLHFVITSLALVRYIAASLLHFVITSLVYCITSRVGVRCAHMLCGIALATSWAASNSWDFAGYVTRRRWTRGVTNAAMSRAACLVFVRVVEAAFLGTHTFSWVAFDLWDCAGYVTQYRAQARLHHTSRPASPREGVMYTWHRSRKALNKLAHSITGKREQAGTSGPNWCNWCNWCNS